MKLRLLHCLPIIFILAAAVFGGIKRQSYTNITKDNKYLKYIQTAEFPEELAKDCFNKMLKSLSNSDIILRVSVSGDIEHIFGASRQTVCVQEVYAGSDLEIGDEIYLTSRHWYLSLKNNPGTLERGFINIMNTDNEYLVFISHQIDTLDDEMPSTYKLVDDHFIAPVFCYKNQINIILPTDEISTYVPYIEVKNNEFFATSKATLDAWDNMKIELLSAYPDY